MPDSKLDASDVVIFDDLPVPVGYSTAPAFLSI